LDGALVLEGAQINRYRVLLVEDNERILHFIRWKLIASDFDVVIAMTGQGALAHIDSQKPDIVVLDLKIPGMGGLQVLKLLHISSSLPVIAISAAADLGKEALSLGAVDFLQKPFEPDELVRRMKMVLKSKDNDKTTTPQSPILTGKVK
jgi:DNA-binding response OmpR family regulator